MTAASLTSAEQVADGVFVLGGVEELDGRISWVPPGARGFLPLNCYAVVEGSDCVVVDAGVAAHEGAVLAQLDALGPHVERTKLVLTRAVEFESIGNATAILRTQPVEAVYSHFPSPAWYHTDPRFDVDDEAARRAAATPSLDLREGEPISVGPARELEVLTPALRLLQAVWLFDRRTGTLFTSDAFGYALMPTREASRIVDEENDETTIDDVEAGLDPKFDWLRIADVGETRDGIRSLFESLDVQAIAPATGCVLRGRAVVRRHVDMVLDVIDDWSDKHGD
jgi:flavorubredoxin